MKSVRVARRSGFLIYHLLISISFSSLLIVVHLIAPFGLNKSKIKAQRSQDKIFYTSTLLTDSNRKNRFRLDFKITVSLSFLQSIDYSPLGNVSRFNFQKW